MNIQGGGISFEVEGTNDKLMKVLEQSRKAISTFSREAVHDSVDIDRGFEQAARAIKDSFNKIDAVIDENLQAIKELEAEQEKLQSQYAEAFMKGDDERARAIQAEVAENKKLIEARKQIINQGQQVIGELNEEQAKLQEQKKSFEQNLEQTKSLKTQLRECKEQLALLEANGKRGTEEFKRLQEEAGRLTDAIGDANQQAKLLAHDNAQLQGFMSGVSGLAGAFTAAQGAAALFVGENENLQRVMLKVQSLMSVTMGLQQVMNTLNKDSAFMLATVTKAKELLTVATNKLSVALGISNVAAKALMATLTLGLSVAITAVIALISHMASEAQKAAEQQKKFNEEVAKAAAKPLSAYIALKTEWENLTGSMKEREKWVQDNADRFEALGLKVYDAKTAEDVLIRNSQKFVEACMAKAKALAAQQLAAEKYEEILKKQAEIEAMPDKVQSYVPSANGRGYYSVVDNKAKAEAKKELEDMKKTAREFIEQQVKFTKKEQQLLAGLGTAGAKVVAGSVEAVEAEISRLQQQYKRAANDTERSKLATKIKKEQEKLKKMQLKTDNGSGDKTPKDPYLDMLQKRKIAYAKYAKWVQSEDATVRVAAEKEFAELLKGGTSYIDYLEKQRATIEGKAKKTATDLKNLATINNEIAELTKQTVLSDFEAQLNRELSLCQTIGDRLEVIAKHREELTRDNSDVDNGKADILRNANDDTIEQAKQETAALLQEYASYTTERIKFEESYARNRELLNAIIHAKEIDSEDEFIAKLLEAKQAYDNYAKEAASDDATVAASAKQRYAELLKGGRSYLEMLQNKIRELEDKQIKVGLDVEGTEQLEKLRALLNAENTTDAQVRAAIEALAALEKQKRAYAKQSGDEQYDEMLNRYKTYQQQITEIHEKYAEERALAEKNGNYEMLAEINKAEKAELSKVAVQKLTESESWEQLFSDIKKLSKETIRKLIDDINRQKIELSAQFSPSDLQAIREQLEKAQQELESRDPFSTLLRSINEVRKSIKAERLISGEDPFVKDLLKKKAEYEKYTNAIKSGNKELAKKAKEEFANLLKEGGTYTDYLKNKIAELEEKRITIGLDTDETESLSKLNILLDKELGAISLLNGDNFRKLMDAGKSLAENFKDITGCMSKIAEQIGNENLKKAADLIDDILTNIEASEKGAQAWGGWWGAIIGGVTDLLPKLAKWLSGDQKIEEQILEHQRAVNELKNAYSQLEHQVKKALGEERYINRKAEINNLRAQQAILFKMIHAEMQKKKTDWDAIAQYQAQIESAARTIDDIISSITEEITQTTAKDLSSKLADALEEAFGAGEKAAESFGKVADSVLRDAVKNALKLQFLEEPLQAAIRQLQHDMGFDDEGSGTFNGLTTAEQNRFKNAIAKAGANFAEAMKMYEDLFKQLDESDPSTLSGAIKGASQESIDLLAGQANAVRVNQVTSLDILRQQLARLSNIDNGVNYVIPNKLQRIIDKLTSPSGDGLRGQGITD